MFTNIIQEDYKKDKKNIYIKNKHFKSLEQQINQLKNNSRVYWSNSTPIPESQLSSHTQKLQRVQTTIPEKKKIKFLQEKHCKSSKSDFKLPKILSHQLKDDKLDEQNEENEKNSSVYQDQLEQLNNEQVNNNLQLDGKPITLQSINYINKSNNKKIKRKKAQDLSVKSLQKLLKSAEIGQNHLILKNKDKKTTKIHNIIKQNEIKKKEYVSIKQQKSDRSQENIFSVESGKYYSRQIINKNHARKAVKRITNSYQDFCLMLNLMNRLIPQFEYMGTYKAYVGKGNNSILIKNALKNRFWWNIVENQNKVNFSWTQNKSEKFIESLKQQCVQINQIKQIKSKYQFNLQLKQQQKNNMIQKYTNRGLHKLMNEIDCQNSTPEQLEISITKNRYQSLQVGNKLHAHNHFEFSWNLTNKKALLYNIQSYYQALQQNPFQHIPLTYHVMKQNDDQWHKFFAKYEKYKNSKNKKNIWILKPGQNTNQGQGIQVSQDIKEIKTIIKNRLSANSHKSCIIQQYLIPFLYHKRKFDIRSFILVTSVNSIIKAYWFEQGYLRTSSKQFTLNNINNRMIHLTNDSIQKKSEQYGKFQNGNKISFNDFEKYLQVISKKHSFFQKVYPEMMKLSKDAIRATYMNLNVRKRQFCFEIFGLDFMIDQNFRTWLIEVNNNPCLDLCSPLLARIIPNLIENAFRIAIDPLFPPPKQYSKTKIMVKELFQSNKFTLLFDSSIDNNNFFKRNLDLNNHLQNIIQEEQKQQKNLIS